ncbi:hypothetical protein F2Q68_00045734 [Brassica cretica]|uniref:Uncharacterized protein n=1 Tax=Brassica cretica TaxID=69181 RepID=A0A8S9LM22_BRACR|nr:hypothetical protein F2Q68_00045734 [Brassica cretica]
MPRLSPTFSPTALAFGCSRVVVGFGSFLVRLASLSWRDFSVCGDGEANYRSDGLEYCSKVCLAVPLGCGSSSSTSISLYRSVLDLIWFLVRSGSTLMVQMWVLHCLGLVWQSLKQGIISFLALLSGRSTSSSVLGCLIGAIVSLVRCKVMWSGFYCGVCSELSSGLS